MKRSNNKLIDDVTFTNLYSQYKIIKTNCKNKAKVYHFRKNLNTNLYELGRKLLNEEYAFGGYNIFLIKENKYRIIMSESIDDKIVSHFLYNFCLKKNLDKKLVEENVATRKGYGSKKAHSLFKKHINSLGYAKDIYALKIDISKFFYSIPHLDLKKLLMHDIKDAFALKILFQLIDSTDENYVNEKIDELINCEIRRVSALNINTLEKTNLLKELKEVPRYHKEYGISIGSVINQFLSIHYLSSLDRYIKENLKCKYYVRYADDILIMSHDVSELKKHFKLISIYINSLGLKVNPKSNIFSLKSHLTFLGKTYFIKNNKLYEKTKNTTYKKAIKKLKYLRKTDFSKYYLSKMSYQGLLNSEAFISIDSEYEFLKNTMSCFVIMKKGDRLFYDKDHLAYKAYVRRKKYKRMLIDGFMKKEGFKHVYISEGKLFIIK